LNVVSPTPAVGACRWRRHAGVRETAAEPPPGPPATGTSSLASSMRLDVVSNGLKAHSRDVAAGAREALHQTLADGITPRRHYNGYGRRGLL
jgi:hypothetical protein